MLPGSGVGLRRSATGSTTIISLYGTHLACLFPQHGPGRKHPREIRLEEWQRSILVEYRAYRSASESVGTRASRLMLQHVGLKG